ncbi:hypothetical protein MIR68_011864 [Amoeboaphelidium protococcarum]|nr:hypothetical protein MIR68_011864 [Amoeboaphelidium protococcarum]
MCNLDTRSRNNALDAVPVFPQCAQKNCQLLCNLSVSSKSLLHPEKQYQGKSCAPSSNDTQSSINVVSQSKRSGSPMSCRCGATDHQRTSNDRCPLYKPRLKYRDLNNQDDNALGARTVTCTVNVGYNTILADEQLRPVILDAATRCTDIYSEASRFLNGYDIWRLERSEEIPDLRLGQGIMRQFFQAVLATGVNRPLRRKNDRDASVYQYAAVYSTYRPERMHWNDGNGLVQLVSNMARQYSFNCKNHVVLNLSGCLSSSALSCRHANWQHISFLDEMTSLRKRTYSTAGQEPSTIKALQATDFNKTVQSVLSSRYIDATTTRKLDPIVPQIIISVALLRGVYPQYKSHSASEFIHEQVIMLYRT